ncbi:hypothetical protein [Sphingomonas solaris]|uniref:EthD family reductase n=1 Tax=Alterirhizorhabdus solaris TaxID=2529389 RepID=A0A558RBK3_9SPHN|nr:hypothetical protein [Sphingomonas solaris]TVV76718.1 hypothetical protein FOY91_03165 [Sphingomonas solaris]
MARYHYVILSQAKAGMVEEYRRWYRDQHLADVRRQPGVVSARLFEPVVQKVYDLEAPTWSLMTMYELETDDPAGTMEAIRSLSGSAGMPATDSIDKSGMVQVIATQIAAID